MRLIDADELQSEYKKYHDGKRSVLIDVAPTIEPPTTTWLGNYCPYRCKHCGRYVDSKERYCPNCGRKAVNYEN